MRVRAAGSDDLARLIELEELCEGDGAWSENLIRDGLAGTVPSVSWLIEDLMRGYVVLSTVGDIAEVQRIGVEPASRCQDLGRTMLEEAALRAARSGADRMLLEVREDNLPALALYASAGFVEIDRRERYYRDGTTAVVMRRTLTKECG